MICFIDVPFVLSRGDGRAGESFQPVTLYLSITVPANATPHLTSPINTTSAVATEIQVSSLEQATEPTIAHVQDSIEPVSSVVVTTPEPLSPPTDRGPFETGAPTPPEPAVMAEMSPAKALNDADEATKAIGLTNAWKGTVARIQWLMNTLSPVAGVRHTTMPFYLTSDLANFRSQLNPYAQMACSLLSAIPKVR
jgi:hypothetical protein